MYYKCTQTFIIFKLESSFQCTFTSCVTNSCEGKQNLVKVGTFSVTRTNGHMLKLHRQTHTHTY